MNELALPVHTPLSFTITSDAAMTSFFIPALGGQIYAMAGMQTRLHLIANETASSPGSPLITTVPVSPTCILPRYP